MQEMSKKDFYLVARFIPIDMGDTYNEKVLFES